MQDIRENKLGTDNEPPASFWINAVERVENSTAFRYTYMVAMLMYILLCGYFLIFAGSLLIEAIAMGWYAADATETDAMSFLLGYLYGFPSLLGVFGGISVMSSAPKSWYRFKVLLFVPAAVWSTLLVIDLVRHPLYWNQFAYHIPAMILCIFVLFGVIRKIRVPYLEDAGK